LTIIHAGIVVVATAVVGVDVVVVGVVVVPLTGKMQTKRVKQPKRLFRKCLVKNKIILHF